MHMVLVYPHYSLLTVIYQIENLEQKLRILAVLGLISCLVFGKVQY